LRYAVHRGPAEGLHRKRMNIHEVARRAKVSTATVSRAMNQVPTVDPQLAKRVWKAIGELSYFPNTQARALVSGRSRIFGLVVSEITNPFFPEVVQTFEHLAVQHNYEILLTSTVHDPKRMEISVRRMIERRVDGVAILTFGMEDSLIQDLRFRKVPLVFVDVGPSAPGVSNIRGTTPGCAAAHAHCIYQRPAAAEIGGGSKKGFRTFDARDRHGTSGRLAVRRRPHHGRRHSGARAPLRPSAPTHSDSVLERHDRDRRDARGV